MRVLLFISILGCCASSFAQTNSRTLGNKSYEVSNHLNNVMAVVTDRKLPTLETSNITIGFNETDIKAFNDYYPYGMLLDGRNKSINYRFGFQGQEKDDEVKGESNSINYRYRVHESRLGRFFAVDPLTEKYSHNSPYAFSENVVTNAVELEGLEKFVVIISRNNQNVITRRAYWRGNSSNTRRDRNNASANGVALQPNTGILYINKIYNTQSNLISTTYDYDSANSTFQGLRTIAAFAVNGLYPFLFPTSTTKVNDDQNVNGVAYSDGQDISIETALSNPINVVNPNTGTAGGQIGVYNYRTSGRFTANFSNDNATLTDTNLASARRAASIYAELLVDNPGLNIQVEGHTSSPEPNVGYNQNLSRRRALFVKQLIVQKARELDVNFDSSRVTSVGYGATRRLVQDVNTGSQQSDGQAQNTNRRIEIRFQDTSDR